MTTLKHDNLSCIDDAPRHVQVGELPSYHHCVGYCAGNHGNDTGEDGSDQPDDSGETDGDD